MDEHMAAPQKKIKSLVMDDQEAIRSLIEAIFDEEGYEAGFASDGQEALRMYRDALEKGSPYDAVFMDLTIPGGMGGEEAIVELLKIDPNTKAIVLTGHNRGAVVADYRSYGFSAVLTKPFGITEFLDVLHRVVGRKPQP